MKKLAFSTLPCEGWSIDELIEACLRFGFQGLEFREGEGYCVSVLLTQEERREIQEKLGQAGIAVTDIGSSLCIKGRNEDEMKLNDLLPLLELCRDIGAPGLRIFLGNFARRKDMPLVELDHLRIVSWIQRACDMAEAYGVSIWIETHNEYATGRVLRPLLDEVNRLNCGVIYDIIHPVEDGEVPEDTIALLGKHCVHVHMKDGMPFDEPLAHDWKYTKFGEGRIPLQQLVDLLRHSGYEGYYSLEWESKWRTELQQPQISPDHVFPHYVATMHQLWKLEG